MDLEEPTFKQPPRPPTPDPEWRKDKVADDGPEQTWLQDLVNAEKPPLTFDDLMSTLINFSAFAMNRLKINKLTKADLVRPVYKLFKGTCKSSIELEYNIDQCYNALMDQLDWTNSKGYLEDIVMRRVDRKLYTFKEGDFSRLLLNDIEDMLLLHVQHKLFNLDGDDIIDLAAALTQANARDWYELMRCASFLMERSSLFVKLSINDTKLQVGIQQRHAKEEMNKQGSESGRDYGESD
ncbi:hypothetical protein Tco_0393379 [Tanacetum coccineum]